MTRAKKYKLVKDDKYSKLYRVVALRDFAGIKKGTVGGLVHGEHNLSHEGTAWIHAGAYVHEEASVQAHAQVLAGAKIRGCAIVRDHAYVGAGVVVQERAIAGEYAYLVGDLVVEGYAQILTRPTVFSFQGWNCYFHRDRFGKLLLQAGCETVRRVSDIPLLLEKYNVKERQARLAVQIARSYAKLFIQQEKQ